MIVAIYACDSTEQTSATEGNRHEKATTPPVSHEYIRKLEDGESDPTIGMLQRLAKALDVPITDLLEE